MEIYREIRQREVFSALGNTFKSIFRKQQKTFKFEPMSVFLKNV